MAKRKDEPRMIPPKEYAELAGAKYQTVMLWLRQNLIEGAQKFALPTGGHYYLVPADAPRPTTRRGPKGKAATNGEVSTATDAPDDAMPAAVTGKKKAGKKRVIK